MKPPRFVVCKLFYEDHSQQVVGNVVRVDRARTIGSDNEMVTIEIRDARLLPKRRRGKSRYDPR